MIQIFISKVERRFQSGKTTLLHFNDEQIDTLADIARQPANPSDHDNVLDLYIKLKLLKDLLHLIQSRNIAAAP
jgi:hypothetical protein